MLDSLSFWHPHLFWNFDNPRVNCDPETGKKDVPAAPIQNALLNKCDQLKKETYLT